MEKNIAESIINEEIKDIDKKIASEQIINIGKKVVFFEELVEFLDGKGGINRNKAMEYRDAYREKYIDLLKS